MGCSARRARSPFSAADRPCSRWCATTRRSAITGAPSGLAPRGRIARARRGARRSPRREPLRRGSRSRCGGAPLCVRGGGLRRHAGAGGEEALVAAPAVAKETPEASGSGVERIDAESRRAALERLAEVALPCGVRPPAGSVLRGVARPGVALTALDADGRAAACAGASASHHQDHPTLGGVCWWGMLATRQDRRGLRLALRLGALAMLDMRRRHGFERIFSGIQPGGGTSEAVCARLGLSPEPSMIFTVIDRIAMPGGATR